MEVSIKCKGTNPLIMSGRFRNQPIRGPFSTIEEAASEKIYSKDGAIGIPGKKLVHSIQLARMSFGMTNLIDPIILVKESFIPLSDYGTWEVFSHKLKHVPGKKPYFDVFPLFRNWGFSATIIVGNEIIGNPRDQFKLVTHEELKMLIKSAGTRTGMGFLAKNKGAYGRFEISEWNPQI